MAIGERIRFLRNLKGMTQKWLGMAVGFDEKTADIRMAQYESGTRTPKENLTNDLAKVLEVSPAALNVPNIDSYVGLMHTLFALEDIYGVKIEETDGDVCLRVDTSKGNSAANLHKMLFAWLETAKKFYDGNITKEEYYHLIDEIAKQTKAQASADPLVKNALRQEFLDNADKILFLLIKI